MKRLFCLFACLSGFSVEASIKNLVVAQDLGKRRLIRTIENENLHSKNSFYSIYECGACPASPVAKKRGACPVSPVTPVKSNDLYDDCVVKNSPPTTPPASPVKK